MTDLSEILSIAGKGGLHKLVGKSKASVIVQSLESGNRFPVFGTQQVSSLEEISVYTHEGDLALTDVFQKIHEKENGGAAPDLGKDSSKLRAYFGEVIENFDEDRVYVSDIRKILRWYNELIHHELLDFTEPEADEEAPKDTQAEKAEE